MSALETGVIAVIAGAAGGVFGPYLSHWLEFLRRGQIRAEERRRETRDMLLAYMQLAMTNRTTLVTCLWGTPDPKFVQEKYQTFVSQIWQTYPYFFWRPRRIKDDELRRRATDLQEGTGTAITLLWQFFAGPEKVPDTWHASAADSVERVEKAIEAVDDRLEQMDW